MHIKHNSSSAGNMWTSIILCCCSGIGNSVLSCACDKIEQIWGNVLTNATKHKETKVHKSFCACELLPCFLCCLLFLSQVTVTCSVAHHLHVLKTAPLPSFQKWTCRLLPMTYCGMAPFPWRGPCSGLCCSCCITQTSRPMHRTRLMPTSPKATHHSLLRSAASFHTWKPWFWRWVDVFVVVVFCFQCCKA